MRWTPGPRQQHCPSFAYGRLCTILPEGVKGRNPALLSTFCAVDVANQLSRFFFLGIFKNSQSGLGACGAGPTCEACRRLARERAMARSARWKCAYYFCKRGSLRSQKNLIRFQFSFFTIWIPWPKRPQRPPLPQWTPKSL